METFKLSINETTGNTEADNLSELNCRINSITVNQRKPTKEDIKKISELADKFDIDFEDYADANNMPYAFDWGDLIHALWVRYGKLPIMYAIETHSTMTDMRFFAISSDKNVLLDNKDLLVKYLTGAIEDRPLESKIIYGSTEGAANYWFPVDNYDPTTDTYLDKWIVTLPDQEYELKVVYKFESRF